VREAVRVCYGRDVEPAPAEQRPPVTPGRAIPRTPLRVAVATAGPLARWQAACVEALAASPDVVLARWVQLGDERSARRARGASGALAAAPTPEALRDVQRWDGGPTAAAGADESPSIDLLVDLSASGVAVPVPWASRVWRFGYGRALSRDPARTAVFDYVRGSGVTYVALVSEPGGVIVREGWLRTVSWWGGEPLENLLLDPAPWLTSALGDLMDRSTEAEAASPCGDTGTAIVDRARGGRPRGAEGIPLPILEVAAAGRRLAGIPNALLRYPDWNVGVIQAPIAQLLDAEVGQAITWLPIRPGRCAADPFGLERDGTLHIFFEDFRRDGGRGVISHTAIDAGGAISDPECVLDAGVHASYPFLVEQEGAVFMLPETQAAGRLVLYEAVDFPSRWRPVATLLAGIPVVDASVIEHDGRWWMFATRHDHGHNHSLFAWHAPHVTGPWKPHTANPVKTDARSARSGGTPFISGGRLYRPSQDNSSAYGRRVVVNRVDVLTPTNFSECPVGIIEPRRSSPYPDGLHTITAVGGRTLVDGNRLHPGRYPPRFRGAGAAGESVVVEQDV
jgi:hypothetical protein